ncbi:MAG TPA: hypothetical protein PKJ51_01620 [Methanothrix sp.]|nr:hypothetical protein [Methanothrix sp.]
MSHDIWIAQGRLAVIDRSPGDVTALPDYDGDGASLIAESDWIALVNEYGSEAALMEALGVTEDLRDEDDWRYEPEEVDDARSRTGT